MHRPQPEQPDPSALPAPPEAQGGPTVGRAQGVKPCPPACARSAAGISIASHISSARDRHRSMGLGQRERQPSGCPPPPLPRTASAGKPPELPRLLQRGVLAAPHLPPGVFAKRLLQPLGEEQGREQPGAGTHIPNTQLPKIQEGSDQAAPPNHPGHPTNGDGWELPAGARRGAGP